jgi:hypothetical protein
MLYIAYEFPTGNVGTTSLIAEIRAGGAKGAVAAASAKSLELPLSKLLDYQLKNYQESLSSFESNLLLQVAFLVLGIFVIVNKSATFEVPGLKISLPRSWLHFFLPLGLLFLWLRFGFLLDDLIKTRLHAWQILTQIGFSRDDPQFKAAADLFHDSGFMDAWFVLFCDGLHNIDTAYRSVLGVLFVTVFGIPLAGAHAASVGILEIARQRYGSPRQAPSSIYRWCLALLPGFAFTLLILSNVLFRYGGGNPNWMQGVVPALAVVFLYVLLYLGGRYGVPEDSGED